MGLYENNLSSMKEYQSELYEKWIEYKEENKSFDNIEKAPAIIDGEYMVIKKGELVWRLNSEYSCSEEARHWCEQYKFIHNENVVLMFGLGNGYFVREICKHLNENDVIYIYEPSVEIFKFVLENYDISDILENKLVSIFVKVNDDDEDFRIVVFDKIDVFNVRTKIMCEHPYYGEMFVENYGQFLKVIKEASEISIVNVNTARLFHERHIENFCKNLKYLKDCSTLQELNDVIPKDATAIVVAAGPSVEENIKTLKKAKGRTIIFAVDRVLDILLDNGIEPDFVVTMDAAKTLEHFTRKPNISIPIIYFVGSNPEILAATSGKKILCYGMFLCELFRKVGRWLPETAPTPSVATSTFVLVTILGIKRVLLVGQDLAFGEEGYSHAGNITEEVLVRNPECMVEGIDGNLVRSRWDWSFFLQWYDNYLYQLSKISEVDVIDIKRRGAKIPRTRNLSFEEALQLYGKEDIWNKEKEEQIRPAFTPEEWKIALDWLDEKCEDLYEIKKKCKRGVDDADRLISYCQNNKVLTNEMQKLAKKLVKNLQSIREKSVVEILETYIKKYAVEASLNINCLSEDEQENNIKSYEYAKSMLEAFEKGVDFMKPLLEEAVESIKKAEMQ